MAAGDTTQGRRLPDGEKFAIGMGHGDYKKIVSKNGAVHWWACPPRGGVGVLDNHEVVEHEDGTITASPSILMPSTSPEQYWHGYIQRGVWHEV